MGDGWVLFRPEMIVIENRRDWMLVQFEIDHQIQDVYEVPFENQIAYRFKNPTTALSTSTFELRVSPQRNDLVLRATVVGEAQIDKPTERGIIRA